MSKLLKSKILLGFMIVAVLLVGVALKASAADCSTYTFTKALKVGSTGAEVTCLQTRLAMSTVTGYYGPMTKAAVTAFQKDNGVSPLGIVGPATRAVLNATTATTTTGGTTTTTGGTTTTTTTTSTGPVTVALSTDNPVAGTVLAGQASADMLHLTFNGSGTVTGVTLKRTGISDQSTLSNVYLYNGVTRLTDGYSFNNTGDLSMSGLNIAVNGPLTLSVKADVYGSTTSYSVGVTLNSYTVSGVTAATPVSLAGNTMYVASGTTVGSAVFNTANQVGTVTNGVLTGPSVNPGVLAYPVWTNSIQISTRALAMKSIFFRTIGSAPTDALANMKFYVDGVAVGNPGTMTTVNGSNYIAFDFSASPVNLATGSHTLDLRADIVKGSARTVQVSLQQASDLMLYDAQVGVNTAASVPVGGVSWSSATTAGPININQGSVAASLDPTFQTLTKVTGGASNVVIAKFKLHAYGEDVKMNTLNILPSFTSGATAPAANGLQNVTMYFNGSQVGSQTANWSSAAIALTPGSQMIVPAGVDSYLEVRADLRTIASLNYTSGTVLATLQASTGEGMTSHNSVSLTGVTGNSLTVQTGLLAVGSNAAYLSQVMNSNTANVKLGSYTLQNQSTSESVRVTSLRVTTGFTLPTFTSGTTTVGTFNVTFSSTVGMAAGDSVTIAGVGHDGYVNSVTNTTVASITFPTGSAQASASATVSIVGRTPASLTYVTNLRTTETSGNGATPVVPTGLDTYSVDFTLAPGTMKTIDIMGDLGAANYGKIITNLEVQGVGASSGVQVFGNGAASLAAGIVTGQTISMATGTVAVPTVLATSSTATQFVAAANTGAASATKATYKFTASNGVANVTELKFSVVGPVTGITIGGQAGSPVAGVVDITGLNLSVPNGGNGVTYDALVSYGSVGTGGTASQTTSSIALTDVVYTIGGQPGSITGQAVTSPVMSVVGSKPTLTVANASNTGLTIGQNKLMDVAIAADSHGDVSLNTLVFNNAMSSGTMTIASLLPILSDNGNPTAATNVTCAGTATVTCTMNGYIIPAGTTKTFSLFGTTGGTLGNAGTSSLATSLGAASTFSWNDDAGAASGTAITSANTTYLYNYPSQTWSIHN